MEVDPGGGPPIGPYTSLMPPTLIRMTGRRLCVAVALVAALTGCGAVQDKAKSVASSAVNKGVSTAAEGIVAGAFTETLSKAGLSLDGDPDCSSDLTTDVKGLTVKGSVDCTGKTTKGDSATAPSTASSGSVGRHVLQGALPGEGPGQGAPRQGRRRLRGRQAQLRWRARSPVLLGVRARRVPAPRHTVLLVRFGPGSRTNSTLCGSEPSAVGPVAAVAPAVPSPCPRVASCPRRRRRPRRCVLASVVAGLGGFAGPVVACLSRCLGRRPAVIACSSAASAWLAARLVAALCLWWWTLSLADARALARRRWHSRWLSARPRPQGWRARRRRRTRPRSARRPGDSVESRGVVVAGERGRRDADGYDGCEGRCGKRGDGRTVHGISPDVDGGRSSAGGRTDCSLPDAPGCVTAAWIEPIRPRVRSRRHASL